MRTLLITLLFTGCLFSNLNAQNNDLFACPDFVKDHEGNTYKTVKIGDQCWMNENLRTTYFENGEQISRITNKEEWERLNDQNKSFDYYNGDKSNALTIGALYNWDAIMNGDTGVQGICPTNWHVPGDNEWKALFDEISMDQSISSSSVDDYSNLFSGEASGLRYYDGAFGDIHTSANFWSSTEINSQQAVSWQMIQSDNSVKRFEDYKGYGFSVRCIKDTNIPIATH